MDAVCPARLFGGEKNGSASRSSKAAQLAARRAPMIWQGAGVESLRLLADGLALGLHFLDILSCARLPGGASSWRTACPDFSPGRVFRCGLFFKSASDSQYHGRRCFIDSLRICSISNEWSKLGSRLATAPRKPQSLSSMAARLIAWSATFRLPEPH